MSSPNIAPHTSTGSTSATIAVADPRSTANTASTGTASPTHGRNVSNRLPTLPGLFGTSLWKYSNRALRTASAAMIQPRRHLPGRRRTRDRGGTVAFPAGVSVSISQVSPTRARPRRIDPRVGAGSVLGAHVENVAFRIGQRGPLSAVLVEVGDPLGTESDHPIDLDFVIGTDQVHMQPVLPVPRFRHLDEHEPGPGSLPPDGGEELVGSGIDRLLQHTGPELRERGGIVAVEHDLPEPQ